MAAENKNVRFIRRNGRVIPIRVTNTGPVAPKRDTQKVVAAAVATGISTGFGIGFGSYKYLHNQEQRLGKLAKRMSRISKVSRADSLFQKATLEGIRKSTGQQSIFDVVDHINVLNRFNIHAMRATKFAQPLKDTKKVISTIKKFKLRASSVVGLLAGLGVGAATLYGLGD